MILALLPIVPLFGVVMSILLIIAIAPVALLLIYIYNRDVISKEPKSMLLKAFFGGVLCILIDLLLILPFQAIFGDADSWNGALISAFGSAFFEAGIPEEFSKFLILYFLVWKSKDFDEHFDGIVYATFISLGFACIENILYVFQGGAGVGIMRAFSAVPGHFFFAVIMGYYFSRAKFDVTHRKSNMIKAIIYPMIIHGIYDMILFLMEKLGATDDDVYNGVIVVLLIFFFYFNFRLWKQGIKRIRELRNDDLAQQPTPQS